MVLGMIPDARSTRSPARATPPARGAHGAVQPGRARGDRATVRRIEKIETAVEPRFQEHFVNANAIPHAVDPFPELAKVAHPSRRRLRRLGRATGRWRRTAQAAARLTLKAAGQPASFG
jgi:uncharacterized 2Fe-2S/4Fe-4S cluster protein (DUF4445 family)